MLYIARYSVMTITIAAFVLAMVITIAITAAVLALIVAAFDTPASEFRDTPLHQAARSGLLPEVNLLLEGGADVDARNGDMSTPLHFAIQHGSGHDRSNFEVITLLLEHGADVNAEGRIDGYGTGIEFTPLHFAIYYGSSPEIIALLLEHGADVDATGRDEETALHLAAASERESSPEIVRLLLEHGADVHAAGGGYYEPTALHMAASRGYSEIVRLLLEYGADVHAKDINGNTPMHYAGRGNVGANPEVLRILIEYGADVNANNEGYFPIHAIASNAQDAEAISILLEHGADINAKDDMDNTPLHLATKGSASLAVIAELLEHGADVNAVGNQFFRNHDIWEKSPRTPLQFATGSYHVNHDVIALLLEYGADPNPNHDDYRAQSPLYYMAAGDAKGESYIDTVRLLLEHGANANASARRSIIDATILHFVGDPEIIEVLLEYGADPTAIDADSYTPLHRLAEGKPTTFHSDPVLFPELLTLLLDHGADIHARTDTGDTPLHLAAARNRHPEVIARLLDSGADIEALANDKATPLHRATRNNSNPEVIRLLLDRGANIEAKTNGSMTPRFVQIGLTPLHYAAAYNPNHEGSNPKAEFKTAPDIVNLLLDRGADVHAKTSAGYTPLHLVVSVGSPSLAVLEALLDHVDHGADVHAKTSAGETPLHVVANMRFPYLTVAQMLLDRGADLDAKDSEGRTPCEIIRQRNEGARLEEIRRLVCQ